MEVTTCEQYVLRRLEELEDEIAKLQDVIQEKDSVIRGLKAEIVSKDKLIDFARSRMRSKVAYYEPELYKWLNDDSGLADTEIVEDTGGGE